MNIEQEINQFRRDLKSYNYHKHKIDEIDLKLQELAYKMQGVSAIRYDKGCKNNSGIYSERKLEFIIREEKLIKERNRHLSEIERIDCLLERLEKDEQELLRDIYFNNYTYVSAARKWNASREKIARDISKIAKKVFANEDD